jgi:hypothetical protein
MPHPALEDDELLDRHGRTIVVVTTRSLYLEVGDVFFVLDGRPFGLVPERGRPADARERLQTARTFYDPTSAKRARQERLEVPDDELDEQAALAAAYAEQRRQPTDLVNIAA